MSDIAYGSTLLEPVFVGTSAQDVTNDAIVEYQTASGKILYPAQVERLIINLIAYRETLLRLAIQDAAEQNLVMYARYPMLDHLGLLVDTTRLQALPSLTTLQFNLLSPQLQNVLIPSGTQVGTTDGNYIFTTTQDLTISAGLTSGQISAQATVECSTANGYQIGDISVLINSIPYVTSVTNTTVSAGGADIEPDDRLRERIIESPEHFSVAGPVGAYHYWAMTANQNIIDASVISPSPGVVNVYPLMNTGIPSTDVINSVLAVLSSDSVRPLTDLVQVLPPTEVNFQINASVTLFSIADSETVQTEVNTALSSYASVMSSQLGKDIVVSQIIGVIMGVSGVYDVTLISPMTDVVLSNSQWANCTGITVNIVGTTNG